MCEPPYWTGLNGVLYHGDCLDVMRGMADKSIDLVLTDPPYGIDENNGKNLSRIGKSKLKNITINYPKCINYADYTWDKNKISDEYFIEIKRISKNQVIFGGNYYGSILGDTSCYIVWDKDNTGDFADCELAWTSFKTATRKIKWRWNGCLQEDMSSRKEKRLYPTQKPVPVMMWILRKYSKPGQTIMDPFCGSGSSLVACEILGQGRCWIGVDKELGAVELAKRRIIQETRQMTIEMAE